MSHTFTFLNIFASSFTYLLICSFLNQFKHIHSFFDTTFHHESTNAFTYKVLSFVFITHLFPSYPAPFRIYKVLSILLMRYYRFTYDVQVTLLIKRYSSYSAIHLTYGVHSLIHKVLSTLFVKQHYLLYLIKQRSVQKPSAGLRQSDVKESKRKSERRTGSRPPPGLSPGPKAPRPQIGGSSVTFPMSVEPSILFREIWKSVR